MADASRFLIRSILPPAVHRALGRRLGGDVGRSRGWVGTRCGAGPRRSIVKGCGLAGPAQGMGQSSAPLNHPEVAMKLLPAFRASLLAVIAALACTSVHPVAAAVAVTPPDGLSSNAPGPRHIVGDVYESRYELRTGPGEHDRIRLHRIVREKEGKPVRAKTAVMLVHGDAWGFDAAFMRGSASPDSLPVFLAARGVDVWGVDLAWTLIPEDTDNYDFMANWGLQHDINDLSRALAVARGVRAATGSGGGAITLGAWSRGGWIGYALLNQETKKPRGQRQVQSFVSMDNFFKTDDPHARAHHCALAAENDGYLAAGDFAYDFRGTEDIGQLAETDPNGPSPYWGPPYTNLGATLSYAAAGFQGGTHPFTPWYHFAAGIFPGGNTTLDPVGLRFTDVHAWDDFVMGIGNFEPVRLQAETQHITCDDGTTQRFDGRLRDVRVPILYVGAAGGFGTYGKYSMDRTGSRDKQTIIVRTLRRGQENADFGHVDLLYARAAKQYAWQRILQWLNEHPAR